MNNAWIALSLIKGLGSKRLLNLYNAFPQLNDQYLKDSNSIELISNIISVEKISTVLLNSEIMEQYLNEAQLIRNRHKKAGIEIVTIGDTNYPPLLRNIENPPTILYCKGNMESLSQDSIAVIGTREPTEIGIKSAKKVARKFVEMGYVIVSGLAEGIDTAAHLGTLEAKGMTIAVMAGGLDKIYPKSNQKLANDIINNNGLLISEYPIGFKMFKSSFVQRDRIQSGLSLGICPVQTDIVGGTQHTISFAQKQNRVIFCPQPLESSEVNATKGIYKLLEDNLAILLGSPQDYKIINDALLEVKKRSSRDSRLKLNEVTNFQSKQTELFN